jgi:hypothetical protein
MATPEIGPAEFAKRQENSSEYFAALNKASKLESELHEAQRELNRISAGRPRFTKPAARGAPGGAAGHQGGGFARGRS